jgi:hypothetical protein
MWYPVIKVHSLIRAICVGVGLLAVRKNAAKINRSDLILRMTMSSKSELLSSSLSRQWKNKTSLAAAYCQF